MLGQIVRVGVGVLVSMMLGAAVGAGYAGVVGTAHLSAYRRWDHIPAFAVGCVLVGALFGLLGGIGLALSGGAAWERADSRSPADSSRHPGPARGTADDEWRGRGRQPERACHHAPGEECPVCPGRFAW